jgi:hypothetical protein
MLANAVAATELGDQLLVDRELCVADYVHRASSRVGPAPKLLRIVGWPSSVSALSGMETAWRLKVVQSALKCH